MLSNLKQFLIKKTPVTLSLLVFVLLVALMLKLSSCRDVVLDDMDEAVSLDSTPGGFCDDTDCLLCRLPEY